MSENYQPNPSVQEAQPQDENCYDDILVRPHFIDRDFADVDDEYGSGIFRRYRDEYARQQIDVFAENPFNQGEPQVGLSNEENLPRLDPNEFGEGREGVSNFTDTAAAHEHSNEGQAQATLSNREQQTQSGPNEVGDGREERSNPQDGLPVNNHTNHEQPPAGLLNEEDGSPLESNEVVEDGAEVSSRGQPESTSSAMSYHPPSHFPQNFDDDLNIYFDLDAFVENKSGPLFPNTGFQEHPDEVVGEENAVPADESVSHEQPETRDLFNGEHDSNFDHEELLKEQEKIAEMLQTVSAMESVSQEQPQEGLANVDPQSSYQPNEVPEYEGETSGLPDTNTLTDNASHDQPQADLLAEGHQSEPEPKESVEDRGEVPSLRNLIPAEDSFAEIQQEDSLTDSQNQAEFEFDMSASENWQNLVANGSFSQIPYTDTHDEQRISKRAEKPKQSGTAKHKSRRQDSQSHTSPVYHAPSPQLRFSTSAALHSVGYGEGPFVNTPGIDSGYGTLNPSREATFGPLSATPNQTSNAVQHSGLANMHDGLDPVYSSHHPGTYTACTEGAKKEAAEDDQNFDPADDLNHYPEDPTTGVIESRRRKGWGRTGTRNGVEVWFNPETKQWQESASHHSYRQVLIARAQAEHPGEEYLHPDETDELPHGETAFYLPHQNFGPDRDDCPNECFVWPEDDPEDEDDSEDEEASKKSQAKKKSKLNHRPRRPDPGFWFEDNKILLDPHNNPVKKHPDMPLTLSSMTEGYKLDLMRILNAGISQRDEWSRMPRWIRRQVPKTDRFIIKYIGSPNTHVNMPSLRFRDEKGAVAGNKREGTKKIKKGLKALFAEHGFDPSLTGSTRGFGRDLFPWEQDLVKLRNKGKHPGRAGEARALDEETRNKNLQNTLKKIEKGRKKAEADAEAAKTGNASGNKPCEDQDGANQNSNPVKRKSGDRPRTGRGKQAPSQPQRYGTYGSVPTPVSSANTLEAGGRSYYGTYGAAPSPYQNTNAFGGYQQAPSLGSNQYIRNQHLPAYPGIGNELKASLNLSSQESREQTWSAQGPVMQNYYPGGQYQPQHYHPPGHMNNGHYGPPVQHQGVSRSPNDSPKYRGNTLGPGGRELYQAPKQVLGRRARGDAGELDEVMHRKEQDAAEAGRQISNPQHESRQEQSSRSEQQQAGQSQAPEYHAGGLESSVQANNHSENDTPSKRRRNNGNAGTEPRPQRRPHNGSAPRPRYYGATGAPMPLILPEGAIETVPHTSNFNGNAGVQGFGNIYQNRWTANNGLGGQASLGNITYGDVSGSHGLVATSHKNERQGMSGVQDQHEPEPMFDSILSRPGNGSRAPQTWLPQLPQNTNFGDFDSFGGRSEGYAPPQTLGKRDRLYSESELQEDSLGPGGKRRRMPSTEGYNLPPGAQRRAEKKLRKSKRDEHLPPPVLNIEASGQNLQQDPQMAATPEIDEAVPTAYRPLQVADAQGSEQPHVSVPTPAPPTSNADVRDMPPATEWECERLQEALEFTRWAYGQWTGMAAPQTNRFDSYNAQFGVIFNSFQTWWGSGSNPERSEPLEWLVQLDPWEGTVADWKPPVANFLFYECTRRGFYAPRNLDGSLQRP